MPTADERIPSMPRPASLRTADFDLWMEIGAACNLNCGFCYNEYQRPSLTVRQRFPVQRPSRRIEGILRLLSESWRIGRVTLAGGELFVYQDWKQTVAAAMRYSSECAIVTNGTRCAPGYSRDLAMLGVGLVQFSLHGATEDIHDSIVGSRHAMRALMSAAAEARRSGIKVGLSYVWCGQAADDISGVIEWAAALDAAYVVVNRVRSDAVGGAKSVGGIEFNDYHTALRCAKVASDDLSVPLYVSGYVAPSLRTELGLGGRVGSGQLRPRLNIDSRGNVRACLTSPVHRGSLWDDNWRELVNCELSGARPPSSDECDCLLEELHWRRQSETDIGNHGGHKGSHGNAGSLPGIS